MSEAPKSERLIVLTLASVQFISILEFMIVMPLGPDFAQALGIPTSSLGIVGGSYTAAAAVAGLVGSFFLERFDRKHALIVLMFLLVTATAMAGLAVDLPTLLMARVAAGIFGGPAMSMALAIIADVVPPERRGRAMGTIMSSFAVSSVAGIPAGLELARWGGWRAPFFAISALGVAVILTAFFRLPNLRGHLAHRSQAKQAFSVFGGLLKKDTVRTAFTMSILTMTGLFLVIPNISTYVQKNLGFPRAQMSFLYLAGGIVSIFTMPLVGRIVDKRGPMLVSWIGTIVLTAVLVGWFVFEPPLWAVLPLFVIMMASSSFRNVPFQTLTSQVPAPNERARYMSLQSCVQHVSTSLGAFCSSILLTEGPNDSLVGMRDVALMSITLTVTLPFLLAKLNRLIQSARTPSEAPSGPAALAQPAPVPRP